VRDHGVPARREGDRWRAVWKENGGRRQCEAVTEERLAAKLEFAYNPSPDYVTQVLGWARADATGRYAISTSQQACSLAAVAQAPSKIAAQIITFALAQTGKPYQWGATGPDTYDCSGLIYAAYRSVGITLPRTTFGMWDLTPHIPPGHEQSGDIVFFNTGPGTSPNHPGHADLVIGHGQMVVASCTTCGPITTTTYRNNPTLVGFVRPLANPAITIRANLGYRFQVHQSGADAVEHAARPRGLPVGGPFLNSSWCARSAAQPRSCTSRRWRGPLVLRPGCGSAC
jgi:cell wall-associated NlpC family hydrolase